MLTKADEGVNGGQANADQQLDDMICGQPLVPNAAQTVIGEERSNCGFCLSRIVPYFPMSVCLSVC